MDSKEQNTGFANYRNSALMRLTIKQRIIDSLCFVEYNVVVDQNGKMQDRLHEADSLLYKLKMQSAPDV
jgi:hypothetical protein